MGATTPPDRRRSLFLFFFSLFYRVRVHRTRDTRQLSPNFHLFIPACSSFRFESIHFRVHFSTIAIIRLALSDRIIEQIDALFLVLFIYVVVASRFIRHGEIRAYKLRSKNKDNRKRTELFSLDPRDSNGKSSGIPNTIRSDGVSLISAISA